MTSRGLPVTGQRDSRPPRSYLSFPIRKSCDKLSKTREKTRPRTVMKRQTLKPGSSSFVERRENQNEIHITACRSGDRVCRCDANRHINGVRSAERL